jgi:hypothetical protein
MNNYFLNLETGERVYHDPAVFEYYSSTLKSRRQIRPPEEIFHLAEPVQVPVLNFTSGGTGEVVGQAEIKKVNHQLAISISLSDPKIIKQDPAEISLGYLPGSRMITYDTADIGKKGSWGVSMLVGCRKEILLYDMAMKHWDEIDQADYEFWYNRLDKQRRACSIHQEKFKKIFIDPEDDFIRHSAQITGLKEFIDLAHKHIFGFTRKDIE